MVLEATRKVPGGKMVELTLETDNEKIEKARIRGDFFLEPPEKLGKLENQLQGLKTDAGKQGITEKLQEVEADMIGFSAEDVAEAFREAVRGDSSE